MFTDKQKDIVHVAGMFAIILGLAFMTTGCSHAFEEYGKVVGCTVAGNNCGANDGVNGTDGSSCTVASVAQSNMAPAGGAILTCPTTSTLILNGLPGAQGPAAAVSSYTIVKKVVACPQLAGSYREVLLVFADGSVTSSFSADQAGNNTRLSDLPVGNYVTTDGRSCAFSVTATQITWAGGAANL